jgi:predicted thioesterase/mRNA-degrading endonuclease toxin of MazEF toxin-antitoxin module
VKRGEVWVGNLNANRGAEAGKIRPVLIIQADFLIAQGSETIVVLPLTTQVRPSKEPLHVTIAARDGLRQACQVMPEQPRTLDRGRLADGPLTALTDSEMKKVERACSRCSGWSNSGPMKASLKPGLSHAKTIEIDEARCIGFMGKEGMVYATPRMVSDVEYTCRDFLLAHLDEGEDSVGMRVEIDHLAATPMGMKVTVQLKVVEVDRRKVTFEFLVNDGIDDAGRGRHIRFVVDKAKSFERIKAKRAKAGLAS